MRLIERAETQRVRRKIGTTLLRCWSSASEAEIRHAMQALHGDFAPLYSSRFLAISATATRWR